MNYITVKWNHWPLRFGRDGITLGPVILVRDPGDAALLAHEQAHVAQWLARPWTHYPRYLLSRAYRLACEAAAYAAQVRAGASLDECARFLAGNYRLKIDEARAREEIMCIFQGSLTTGPDDLDCP